jgi:hypothetical protein
MGLAHWSGIAHPIKPAQDHLAQGPSGKIPNACLVPRLTLSSPTDCRPWSHAAHGFTALPLASSTTSPYLPLQVEANPFSSSSCSLPPALLFNGHQSFHCMPPSTMCRAASPSALQDHVGSPSAAPTPSHRPVSSHRRALKPAPPATSSTATSSMTSSSSHRPSPPRRR